MDSVATSTSHQAVERAGARHRHRSAVPFRDTLASEWTKFSSVRITWILAALAIGLAVVITTLVSWVTGLSWTDWPAADQAAFDPIVYSFVGLIFGSILLVVMGVQLVAPEYANGMMRQTLATTPRRGRVLLAKLLVVTLASLAVGSVTAVTTFLAGQAVFRAYDLPTASLADSDARRAVIGLIVTTPVFPVIGVAAAFLLRSAAGAITAVLALLFVPGLVGALLPRRWQEDVLAYLPGSLADSVALAHADPGNPLYTDPVPALLLLAAWLALICGAALYSLTRRDV